LGLLYGPEFQKKLDWVETLREEVEPSIRVPYAILPGPEIRALVRAAGPR